MRNQKKSACDTVMLCIALLILVTFAVCIYVLPAKTFSEEENRALSSAPRLTLDRLLSGDFFESLSSFYSDAFPMRNTFVRAKAFCELVLGKQENNQIRFLEDGRLVESAVYEDTETLFLNLDGINASGAVKAIVPTSAQIYTEGEASSALARQVCEYTDSSALYEQLRVAALSVQSVYYKTDHHLSADGAYILYSYIMRELGETPYSRASFREEVFSTDFYGSIYSKCGLVGVPADTLALYRYDGDTDYSVICHDAGCALDSLYCFDAADIKDKYRVFTNGNHGMLEVRSGEARPTLLVIKDSFANACLPLLARHFDLVVYDPRYAVDSPPECDMTVFILGTQTLLTWGTLGDGAQGVPKYQSWQT